MNTTNPNPTTTAAFVAAVVDFKTHELAFSVYYFTEKTNVEEAQAQCRAYWAKVVSHQTTPPLDVGVFEVDPEEESAFADTPPVYRFWDTTAS